MLTVYADRSFDFILKSPPAAVLLKQAAGLDKGSPTPNTEKVGKVTRAQVHEIAERKMDDLNANDDEAGRPHHHGHGPVDGDRDRGLSRDDGGIAGPAARPGFLLFPRPGPEFNVRLSGGSPGTTRLPLPGAAPGAGE